MAYSVQSWRVYKTVCCQNIQKNLSKQIQNKYRKWSTDIIREPCLTYTGLLCKYFNQNTGNYQTALVGTHNPHKIGVQTNKILAWSDVRLFFSRAPYSLHNKFYWQSYCCRDIKILVFSIKYTFIPNFKIQCKNWICYLFIPKRKY